MENLANLEALLNIFANGIEICGIACGLPLLLLCFIPRAAGLKGYTRNIAIGAICMIVVGLGFPGLLNLIVSSSQDAHTSIGIIAGLVVSAIVCLAMLGASVAAYFLPTIIAYREGRQQKVAITICNVCGFIPLAWLAAFIWASISPKSQPPVAE